MHVRSLFTVVLFAAIVGAVHIGNAAVRQRPMAHHHNHGYSGYKAAELARNSTLDDGFLNWVHAQDKYAKQRILANIAPFAGDPSAMPGAVCASPSRAKPDYYYSWTRDSALVMNEMFNWLLASQDAAWSEQLMEKISDYIAFTKHLQSLKDLKYGLGEAKFNMDGTPFTGDWCSAQSDGPGLRALMLTRLARYLLDNGQDIGHLYNIGGGASSPIKVDLDYVSRVWHENIHCDIWEESRGLHFYTLMAQRRALKEGAVLADVLGDTVAAQKYRGSAESIKGALLRFWDNKRNYILATIDKSGGIQSKNSNLDSQVFLSALHSGLGDGFFSIESREMMATVLAILRRFEPMYAINSVLNTDISGTSYPIGIAVGRYPEDIYNGVGTSRGNPWSLVTSGIAEYHYRLASLYAGSRQVAVTSELADLLSWSRKYLDATAARATGGSIGVLSPGQALSAGMPEVHGLAHYLLAVGDLYMARVARHTSTDGTMYEQWYSYDGYGRGAIHLTWSYAAQTAASRARSQAVSSLYR